MLRTLLNLPLPDQGDLPERVIQQAAVRIRRYWAIQSGLLAGGMAILWLSAEMQSTTHARVYLLPVAMHLALLALSQIPRLTMFWLISVVGGFSMQGALIDGLGGITAISLILPYTFAAMLLAGRKRIVIQAVCVVFFWFSLIYEILPFVGQIETRRLIFVSYNILIATLTFQTLRFLNRLAVELNTAHVAQEVTLRSQQFLARVSHELRTPLNSVLGFAKLLRRSDLPQPGTAYLQQIVDEGEQLNRLVSDLLDSAHLATGKMRLTLTDCDVNAVCRAVGEEVVQALRPGVSLRLALSGDLPTVRADELRLRQIVRNLAINAAKFTERGEICLATAARSNLVQIAVTDTGPGIPDEAREIVFVPFVKRDDRTTGVGLGLDIARQLARLHGGDVLLTSILGQGSTFTVELPFRR